MYVLREAFEHYDKFGVSDVSGEKQTIYYEVVVYHYCSSWYRDILYHWKFVKELFDINCINDIDQESLER